MALTALGTVPSLASLICVPVTESFLSRLAGMLFFLIFEPLSRWLAPVGHRRCGFHGTTLRR
jgi:hypothetical protein